MIGPGEDARAFHLLDFTRTFDHTHQALIALAVGTNRATNLQRYIPALFTAHRLDTRVTQRHGEFGDFFTR